MTSRMLLERCVKGLAPLPEADVESMARQAGLPWVQRRGPLLMRTLIARAPEVSGSQHFPALYVWELSELCHKMYHIHGTSRLGVGAHDLGAAILYRYWPQHASPTVCAAECCFTVL